jgi:hypothetical protein
MSGGQIILSSCSTQFGDFTLVSNGSRQIIFPDGVTGVALYVDTAVSATILSRKQGIVNQMMAALSGLTQSWTTAERDALRLSGETYVQSVYWTFDSGTEIAMENFAKNFYNVLGDTLIPAGQQSVYLDSFENMRIQINALPGIGPTAEAVVNALTTALRGTITAPTKRTQPSLITAIGHQWSSVLAGVALARIPPAANSATIEASILEQDDGLVIASGQDDQGSALFVGGMKISSETGELSGPPFDSAVGRIATKTAIAFSSF